MKSFPIGLFTLAVILVGTSAHAVLIAWARRVWPWVDRHARGLLITSAAISALPSTSRQIVIMTRNATAEWVNAAAMIELSIVVFAAVPLAAVVWIARRRSASGSGSGSASASASASGAASVSRRDALHTIGGAAVISTTGLTLGWGATRGRHDYTVFEVPVRIAGLPKSLDGYVIAQVSDLHAGLFTGDRELRDGLDFVRAMKPDLVVATGDLVDFDWRDAPRLARALANLPSRDGVFGILGNHDYYAGAPMVAREMQRAGITMLVNESRVIRGGDGGFALVGLDDEWSQRMGGPGPDLTRATRLLAPELPRILLAHQPTTFRHAAGKVALQLSGHTHGGQIEPAAMFMRWSAGRYERSGSTLYVNRGFGVAGPPSRIGVPPEITKLILVAA